MRKFCLVNIIIGHVWLLTMFIVISITGILVIIHKIFFLVIHVLSIETIAIVI